MLGDTDFTQEWMVAAYNHNLANSIGNLVNRTMTLSRKYLGGAIPIPQEGALLALAHAGQSQVDDCLAVADIRGAAAAICRVSEEANRVFAGFKPWSLGKDGKLDELSAFLGEVIASCHIVAHELVPFLPDGAQWLQLQLGQGETLPPSHPGWRRSLPRPH